MALCDCPLMRWNRMSGQSPGICFISSGVRTRLQVWTYRQLGRSVIDQVLKGPRFLPYFCVGYGEYRAVNGLPRRYKAEGEG